MLMDYQLDPELWVDKYGDDLYNFAIAKVSKRETAEDLVQDTFVSAYKGQGEINDDSHEKSWLINILRNKIIDYYRAQSIRMHDNFNEEIHFDEWFDSTGHWINDFEAWHGDPEKLYHDAEFKKVFTKCLSNMKSKYKAPFTLRDIYDLPTTNVMENLVVSRSHFDTLIHRARVLMRRCLTINWFGETNE